MTQIQPTAYLNDLHQLLLRTFNAEELTTLCFRLGLAYDDLEGQGRSGKARELVLLLDRTGRLAELHEAITAMRPTAGNPPPSGGPPPAAPARDAPPVSVAPPAAPQGEAGETPAAHPRFTVTAGEMKVGKLVQGVYQEGGAPVDWSALLPHLPDAAIQADSLAAEQMTQGVHLQAGPAVPLPPAPLVAALRTHLDGLELPAVDLPDIDAALQAVAVELGKAAPNQRRILARLDEAAALVGPVAATPSGNAFLAQLLVLRQALTNHP